MFNYIFQIGVRLSDINNASTENYGHNEQGTYMYKFIEIVSFYDTTTTWIFYLTTNTNELNVENSFYLFTWQLMG